MSPWARLALTYRLPANLNLNLNWGGTAITINQCNTLDVAFPSATIHIWIAVSLLRSSFRRRRWQRGQKSIPSPCSATVRFELMIRTSCAALFPLFMHYKFVIWGSFCCFATDCGQVAGNFIPNQQSQFMMNVFLSLPNCSKKYAVLVLYLVLYDFVSSRSIETL